MSTHATLPLRPGDRVGDDFEVDRVLGVGGMGAVFAARSATSGAWVAIKCLLPIFCENHDVVTRFQREARATSGLRSEHLARVYDAGVLDSGVPYIVMEYLEGRDLRALVKDAGPLAIEDAAGFVVQACSALAEAHAEGIVHRDLKPANLFLARRPDGGAVVKVLDFGIAKFAGAKFAGDVAEMTRTSAVLGSRAYMSPEQMLQPKDVDARTDIWSLGVILHFLVTGRNPFASETTEGLILNVLQGKPEPLLLARPDVPLGFEAIVGRCLAKAREDRFGSAMDLARALTPFARSDVERGALWPEEAPTRVIPAAERSAPSMRAYVIPELAEERATESLTRSGRRGHPAILWLSAAALLAVAIGLAMLRGSGAALAAPAARALRSQGAFVVSLPPSAEDAAPIEALEVELAPALEVAPAPKASPSASASASVEAPPPKIAPPPPATPKPTLPPRRVQVARSGPPPPVDTPW